jgi:segregation and condensation protein A
MIQVVEQPQAAGTPEGAYRIRLDNFEGPLDLLLHLIKQDEIEIWEISISRITRQYVEYLELMEALNIEIASEFLVMAATLMRLKSQRLLPRPAAPGDDEEILTEEDLIGRLIAYKLFKEVAADFRRRHEETGPRFPRGHQPTLPNDYMYPLKEVDLYTLVRAFQSIETRETPPPAVHQVQLEDVRLEDQVALVLERLEKRAGRITFGEIFERRPTRMEIAVAFLAMLELARQQVVCILQDQVCGAIWIVSREVEEAVVS